jgi:hypothetical protein
MRACYELLDKGGKWLGAARSWLQWNTGNGDRVTWGSNEAIHPPMTARHVEELASCVAEAAAEELKNHEEHLSKLRVKHLRLEMEFDAVVKQLATHGETWKRWDFDKK